MIAGDPNVASVGFVAAALGELCDDLVLVGGCAASLLIDAPTAPRPRVTYDVDLIAVVTALREYHAAAAATASRQELPGGLAINLIAAPAFLGTKFEAFRTRGQSDVLLSHDFEDIINVVEGRLAIVQEVDASEEGLRAYLGSQFARVQAAADFFNVLPGLLAYDGLHAQRLERVQQRIAALAAMDQP